MQGMLVSLLLSMTPRRRSIHWDVSHWDEGKVA